MPRLIRQSLCFAALLATGLAFAQEAPEPAAEPPAPGAQAADVEAEVRAESRTSSPEAARPQTHRDDATINDPPSDVSRTVQNELNRSDSARSANQRAALGVTFGEGMVIRQVLPNSPAARFGLRSGDEIITLNGQDYDEANRFADAVRIADMNQDAEIVYLRDGEQHTATGRLGAWNTVYTDMPYSGQRTAMRYPRTADQGGYVEGGSACCGQQTGGYASGGYTHSHCCGYQSFDHGSSQCCDDNGGRRWRRARRCCW